ncbi:hypothetical protein N0V88_001376 [Collariella sp. IMI 366227]|nr:hypothetical protein N0V88_001376 [Collariella sp. IMI 366227]
MGASDSKLVFKKGIFRLSEDRHIPSRDAYWASFWELPESSEDIFSLFAPADVRRTRDNAPENLESLINAVTDRLFVLRHHPSFPDPELAPDREALNCIRVLTRVLPFIYEKESLQQWDDELFWLPRRKPTRKAVIANEAKTLVDEFEDAKPLAEELIDTLLDLLFFSDLTVPKCPQGKPKVSYAIWQSGVGCNTTIPTTREHESNRCEILRLLLTLASRCMYLSPAVLPNQGTKALTYICTCPDKQLVLSVLCSLLNTTLKYNPASWRVPYNALVFKDPKEMLVTYTLQFLLATVVYPIPEREGVMTPKNYYRHFFGRLHRPQDFQFVVDGMTRILNQPLQANSSYIPGAQTTIKFAPEIIMLFWEITQCNKRFRSFIIDTERAYDFVILILFYALEYKGGRFQARGCEDTLSVEKNFGVNLNKAFEAQDTLPQSIRIAGFRGTYGDFLIQRGTDWYQSIYGLITTSQGKLTAIYPALLAVINNTAAHLEGLSAPTCSRIMQLFNSMSSPSFLLANETNHALLRSLLEAINSIVEHQYSKDGTFAIGDDDDSDDEARPTPAASSPRENPSVASSVASATDDDVPRQLEGMSEKARGKRPAGAGTFSRQNSTASLGSPVPGQSQSGVFEPSAQWIDTWLADLPLHTTLTLLQQLSALISRQLSADTPSSAALGKIRDVHLVGVEPSPIRVHSFEWSPLALGWYESLLWGFIFASEMQVSKGTVGVWNTTHIKLFRVQETAPQGPTLTSPRGAVDAVGSNIVSRIGAINLRGVAAPGAGNGNEQAAPGRGRLIE